MFEVSTSTRLVTLQHHHLRPLDDPFSSINISTPQQHTPVLLGTLTLGRAERRRLSARLVVGRCPIYLRSRFTANFGAHTAGRGQFSPPRTLRVVRAGCLTALDQVAPHWI